VPDTDFAVAAGTSAPLGATPQQGGVNFSIHARHGDRLELCLFDGLEDPEPTAVIAFSGDQHRSGSYWHGWLAGLQPGQLYGYRHPADPDCLLLDPYGLAVAVPEGYSRQRGQRRNGEPACGGGGWAGAMKSVVADLSAYDWEGDRPLQRPARETVIYELHVRGFTADRSDGVSAERAGTYAGLIDKIPYLQELGITAVELLPVFAFDAQAAPAGLSNYWGYQPISVLAPHPGYARGHDPLAALDEFRDLVKALHRAGIEVILDVVFNHTAEGAMAGTAAGPTLSYRGLAANDYYLLQGEGDSLRDLDVTGCANTLNANNPVVRRLIRHSLRHWVQEMHVDGFRFDLAAVLSRDEAGNPEPRPPILLDLDSDPVLAGTKLIAEAWDAAGLYEVGSFVGERWQEWNGRFRDDLRHFLKGDGGTAWAAAQRLIGSPDVYGQRCREAELSVNFITCHDGFTLADWVSYDGKHNDANGEDNRDGSDDNASWNCGVEGPSDDPEVLALRARQMRNALCLLLLASGTPMLTMGDEVGRSQAGNNNAYCQDNPTSWFDWSLVERHADLLRFTRELIAFRQRRDVVVDHTSLSLSELLRRCAVEWHGVEPGQPDWGPDSHSFALSYSSAEHRFRLQLMVNAWWQPLRFRLPPTGLADGCWHRWIDTALPSPNDIVAWTEAPPLPDHAYAVQARSVVALVVRQSGGAGEGSPGW
jgi:isoamylase